MGMRGVRGAITVEQNEKEAIWQAAKAMMLKSAEPLSQIAYLCGFADQAHFSRTFRKLAGATPLAWRRAHYALA